MDNIKRPCLFLDRDGIIIKDTHYPHLIEEAILIEEIIPIIKSANAASWIVIVVTNQAGIAKGIFSEQQCISFHHELDTIIKKKGANIDKWYYCPYHKEAIVEKFKRDSPLRKPRTGMIELAEKDFSIDMAKSVMIGDKNSDNISYKDLNSFLIQGEYSLDASKATIFKNHLEAFDFLKLNFFNQI